jgi:spermidine synthase
MLTSRSEVIFEGDTELEHYQVVDTIYDRRPARVLYSGDRAAAQSGIARDDNSDLLFDYNQRFFELISGLWPKRLLLIGGGVYTLPMAVLKTLPDIEIDVVELDPGLDDIAKRFFDLRPDKRLRIMHGDGREYLDANTKAYDMIIVDAFINLAIPRSLSTPEAAKQLASNLRSDGVVAMNIIAAYHGRNSSVIRAQYQSFDAVFNKTEVFPASGGLYTLWLPQNLVLTAQNDKTTNIAEYLRFKALPPPKE